MNIRILNSKLANARLGYGLSASDPVLIQVGDGPALEIKDLYVSAKGGQLRLVLQADEQRPWERDGGVDR